MGGRSCPGFEYFVHLRYVWLCVVMLGFPEGYTPLKTKSSPLKKVVGDNPFLWCFGLYSGFVAVSSRECISVKA